MSNHVSNYVSDVVVYTGPRTPDSRRFRGTLPPGTRMAGMVGYLRTQGAALRGQEGGF